MSVLRLDGVTKRFENFTAVDDLSFEVPEGGIFGFLGANGAGKTTTLRMALDILRPTHGTIEVLGAPPGRRGAGDVGFLPEERGLYRQMTALETVIYFGRLKGMSRGDAERAARGLLDRFSLASFAERKVEQLSKGMAQKVQLAAALVTGPRLIILDEPFSGLDPVNQAVLEDEVLERAKAGATVVFSTHVMQHAERLCDRLLLLARGRKVFQGDQEAARAQLPARLSLSAKADPGKLPGVERATAGGQRDGWTDWEITLKPGASSGAVLEACTSGGFALRDFETRRASLHEVFLHLVGDPAAAGPEARP
ncbi:MAG: ABC transporter ATP-binding protein [Phenylobacterium sp.]